MHPPDERKDTSRDCDKGDNNNNNNNNNNDNNKVFKAGNKQRKVSKQRSLIWLSNSLAVY